MAAETTPIVAHDAAGRGAQAPAGSPRLWPGVALITAFWVLQLVVGPLDKPYFVGFLLSLATAAVLTLSYSVWWWLNRRIPLADRACLFGLVVAGSAAAMLLSHRSVTFAVLTLGPALAFTTLTLWMLVVKYTGIPWVRRGALVVMALAWAPLTLVRMDGVDAELQADFRWRWSSSAEDRFRAYRASAEAGSVTPSANTSDTALSLTPGDWPGFRGPERDGVVRGLTVSTDWQAAPPRPLWRHPVGPAWSSVAVVGERLFTQEQRDDREAVVCYDAATGREVWAHEDATRFWEAVSGAGPRATPTFADGRLYTLGARGMLNCLDAATGKRHWSHDLAAEVGAQVPMWGLSCSPVVTEGKVIVFAGGKGPDTLFAFEAESGRPAWRAPVGEGSYSSPQLATLGGRRQCLFLSDAGLTAVDPATGAVLWTHGLAMPGAPRTAQPHVLGDSELLVASLAGHGVARIEVTRDGDAWKPKDVWASTDLNPEFPDLVAHQGHAYGFDVNVFCCIDLATGKRCWRAGRYGRGQVILLADQGLLLVLSEKGEAVLLSANPQRHEELGRFQALNGKTWNHPVLVRCRLYVRNAEEMACYELTPQGDTN
jgi:outer membrane protein assembly factor BamB